MNIKNFAIAKDVTSFQSPYKKIHLSKWKFLEKGLNRLISFLGGCQFDEEVSMLRIAIEHDSVYKLINEISNDFAKKTGRRPKCVVIGYDNFHALQIGVDLLWRPTNIDLDEMLGMKIVLHPMINGILPLDFAP